MKDARYAFGENIVPLKAPVDSAGTAYATPYVNLKNSLHATFFVYFGVITATSADQNIVITMEASTAAASNATETQIPFNYRLSGATGANSWGAVTAATASGGASIDTTSGDGKLVAIDCDFSTLVTTHGQYDAAWARLVIGIDAGGTVTLNAVWVELDPRFPQTTQISAT